LKVEIRDISTLKLDPKNVRRHDNKNLDAIKGSLEEFGQQKPIVIDSKGYVIAGNGTLAAAKQLGWTQINVTVSDLNKTKLKAYALADNRTSDMSFFDDDLLKEALAELQMEDFDITKIGFDLDLDFGEEEPESDSDKEKTYRLEISFSSQEEMKEVYDDLIARGLLVKAHLNG